LIILWPKALQARPSFDERSVDAEVLITHPVPLLGDLHDGGKEDIRRRVTQQTFLVFTEDTRVKERVKLVGIDIQKPLKEQVILEPFTKLPLAAHAIKSHQHLGCEQALRGNRVAPFVGIERLKVAVQTTEDIGDHPFDLANGMGSRNPLLDIYQGHEVSLGSLASSHAKITGDLSLCYNKCDKCSVGPFFSNLLAAAPAVLRQPKPAGHE
jgi:hypothetical protein